VTVHQPREQLDSVPGCSRARGDGGHMVAWGTYINSQGAIGMPPGSSSRGQGRPPKLRPGPTAFQNASWAPGRAGNSVAMVGTTRDFLPESPRHGGGPSGPPRPGKAEDGIPRLLADSRPMVAQPSARKISFRTNLATGLVRAPKAGHRSAHLPPSGYTQYGLTTHKTKLFGRVRETRCTGCFVIPKNLRPEHLPRRGRSSGREQVGISRAERRDGSVEGAESRSRPIHAGLAQAMTSNKSTYGAQWFSTTRKTVLMRNAAAKPGGSLGLGEGVGLARWQCPYPVNTRLS